MDNAINSFDSMQVASTRSIDISVFVQAEDAIHSLNHTSVDIRIDEAVRAMQNLTNEIRQSVSEQQSLNHSMDAMNIGQGTTDYQQLNQSVDETEQQIQNNTVAQQEFGNEVGHSMNLAGKLKSALVSTATGVKSLLDFSNGFTQASNMLQAQTGATAEEMAILSNSMKNIYGNNFGESFQDIASSMLQVKQLTGQTGKELEATTQTALLMRDTFGFEINKSIRAADMMVKQFGISSESAYNLIAQGAQHGLDKNGDLLDTINEHSAHFKALGVNADQMFNMLVNGADAGVFGMYQLGDAIKAFGSHAMDGSNRSIEAFKTLGLDASDMIGRFRAGGDTAREAFDKVTQALGNMKNPVDQNTVAVALFGSMAEDLGVNAVLSMQNLEGGISSTKNTLEEMNQVRYNDLESAITGIGKSISAQLLEPMSLVSNALIDALESASPVISWFSDTILPMICGAILYVINGVSQLTEAFTSRGGEIQPILDSISNGILWLATNIFPIVSDAVLALGGIAMQLVDLMIANWPTIETIVASIGNTFMLIAANVLPVVTEAFSILGNGILQIADIFLSNWSLFQPIIDAIGLAIVGVATTVFPLILSAITFVTDAAIQFSNFVVENWSLIEPIIVGIGAALAVYTALTLAHAAAEAVVTGAKKLAQAAQNGLNSAILKSPITWIAVAIGVLVGIIYKWVQSVGGLKIAWLICVDKILYAWDLMSYGCQWLVTKVLNGWDNIAIGIERAKVGILDTIGNLKVAGLKILENFINGAIDRINDLINLVSKTGLISIDIVKPVEFGTNAAIEETKIQAERANGLDKFIQDKNAAKIARESNLSKVLADTERNHEKRLKEIEDTRKELEKNVKEDIKIPGTQEDSVPKIEDKKDPPGTSQNPPGTSQSPPGTSQKPKETNYPKGTDPDNLAGIKAEQANQTYQPHKLEEKVPKDIKETANNTKEIKESLNITSEDLKYMRDIAEQEIVNRFTTAEIKVEMINHNTINQEMDLDGITNHFRQQLEEEMYAVAEGVH